MSERCERAIERMSKCPKRACFQNESKQRSQAFSIQDDLHRKDYDKQAKTLSNFFSSQKQYLNDFVYMDRDTFKKISIE